MTISDCTFYVLEYVYIGDPLNCNMFYVLAGTYIL